jgi:bacteriophage exclusion system BrxC/D-like protein
MSTSGRLAARRAIEALRSGVPSRDAVAALGSGQSDIEDRFTTLIDGIGQVRTGPRGLLLGGGFGAGKSHVLEHLTHLALDRGYAVSRIVVSKETPLHDPAKVLRAAVESAVLPDGSVGAVARRPRVWILRARPSPS